MGEVCVDSLCDTGLERSAQRLHFRFTEFFGLGGELPTIEQKYDPRNIHCYRFIDAFRTVKACSPANVHDTAAAV